MLPTHAATPPRALCSEYNGNPDELNAGDELEFTASTDRKSQRLTATNVVALPKGTLKTEVRQPNPHTLLPWSRGGGAGRARAWLWR